MFCCRLFQRKFTVEFVVVLRMVIFSYVWRLASCETSAYGHMVKLCSNVSMEINSEALSVANKQFPEGMLVSNNCSCIFQSRADFMEFSPVFFNVTTVSGTQYYPLTMKINQEAVTYTIRKEIIDDMTNHFKTNGGIKRMTFTLTPGASRDTYVSFMFTIQPLNASDVIDVRCQTSGQNNDTNVDKTTPAPKVNGDSFHAILSVEFMLILISLSAALLLIVLVVSVMLCCVMPRKQRREIRKVRESMMLLDSDAPKADFVRPHSHIYDNTNSRTVPNKYSDYRQSNMYQNV